MKTRQSTLKGIKNLRNAWAKEFGLDTVISLSLAQMARLRRQRAATRKLPIAPLRSSLRPSLLLSLAQSNDRLDGNNVSEKIK
jgi:hypothetical protein